MAMGGAGGGTTVKKKRVDPAKQIKTTNPNAGFTPIEGGSSSRGGSGTTHSPIATGSPAQIMATGTSIANSANAVNGLTPPATGAGAGGFNTGTGGTTTPFGNAFLPTMYDEAWSNPDTLVRELFRQKGIGTEGGSYATTLDQADKLGLLWMLQQGNDAAQGTPNFIDWSGNYLNQQLTPGGRSVSTADIANDLLNARTDPNNPTRNYLANAGLTPSDQVGNILSTLNTGLQGANMPDIVRAAYMARTRELGDTFQNNRMRGVNAGTSFLDSSGMTGFLNSIR